MTSIADGSVIIQSTSRSVLTTPSWFGEATLMIEYLRQQGVLSKICERVRFARRRFGHYEVIDFLDDLLSRPLANEGQTGDLMDREGGAQVVLALDGTREAARQRALPQREELPPPFRRLDDVCAAGYTGRKRGEVVRTRTVARGAHRDQWLGSFGNRGNGLYRAELRQALGTIGRYLAAHQLPSERAALAAGWAIGHRGCALRSDWLLVRDARQRVRRAGSSPRPGPSALASRSAPAADSKAS